MRSCFQSFLPVFSSSDPISEVYVEENVLPTIFNKPIPERPSRTIVVARMAQKYTRHGGSPWLNGLVQPQYSSETRLHQRSVGWVVHNGGEIRPPRLSTTDRHSERASGSRAEAREGGTGSHRRSAS